MTMVSACAMNQFNEWNVTVKSSYLLVQAKEGVKVPAMVTRGSDSPQNSVREEFLCDYET